MDSSPTRATRYEADLEHGAVCMSTKGSDTARYTHASSVVDPDPDVKFPVGGDDAQTSR